jgi:hypothetical protein
MIISSVNKTAGNELNTSLSNDSWLQAAAGNVKAHPMINHLQTCLRNVLRFMKKQLGCCAAC